MGRWALVVGVAVAVIALGAAPAWGAFPGGNGDLVVGTSHGLEVVSPATGAATPICTNALLCGLSTEPRYSPNGQAIAFVDSATSRLVVVGSDGSCLWCLLGPSLTSVTGSDPAFLAGARAVTIVAHGLWRVSLTGGGAQRVVNGPVSDAVWSSHRVLALVRRGWVWIRAPGQRRLRRLGRGHSPSFSPDGSELAIVRNRRIWILPLAGGHQRLLASGSSPAWSPTGGRLAYIKPGGAVEVVSLRGGQRHRVGSVIGSSLDWQPLPRSKSQPCRLPRDATVVAASAEAVAYTRPTIGPYDQPAQSLFACLRATDRVDQLASNGYPTSFGTPVLSGRFAAVPTGFHDRYGNCANDLSRDDLAAGSGMTAFAYGCSLDAIGPVVLDSSGFMAWRTTSAIQPYASIDAVSCPTASLCIASDAADNIWSSSDPTGGASAWASADVQNYLYSIDCPSTTLCVGGGFGLVLTSTNPGGGAGAWKPVQLPGIVSASGISCPSSTECFVAAGPDVLWSTDPTGGASAWSAIHIEPTSPPIPFLTGISCPATSLCVAVDQSGDVLTSSDPTGGASAWQSTKVDSAIQGLDAVSCPTSTLCVAVDGSGNVFTSTSPTGGAGSWTKNQVSSSALSAVSCPSSSLCVAVGQAGEIWSSTTPTTGKWTIADADGTNSLTSISCPSTSFCAAADQEGRVLTSTNPVGDASAWTKAPLDVQPCSLAGTSCITEQLYARDDSGTRLIDSAPPANGNSIGNVALSGDSLTLSWTHNGTPEQMTLR